MDPNEALRQLRLLVKQLQAEDGNPPYPTFVQHARDLAEYADALDGWLSHGGFLPTPWAQGGIR